MSARSRVLGAVAGALGVAAAGTAVGVLRQQHAISLRAGEEAEFGSLRSTPTTVVASDGVPLHVEVDEVEQAPGGLRRRLSRALDHPELTVVFAHGYCLNLDSWHFQRAAYRGLVRTVYYDQRSHGRSGRSDREHSTIEQLGDDLLRVIEATAPDGPVVVVGHSMGGMTIVALAEAHPELFGDRVAGVALVSTTAGGLDPGRLLLPMFPARLTGGVTYRAMATLRRGHRPIDLARRASHAVAVVATDRLAFGDKVPQSYVDFVDAMLSSTPFEVVADFFPSFRGLDKFDAVEVMTQVPTSVICGTKDWLTSIGHSRKLHSRIAGSRLLELEGAGHMVPLERHDRVNAELDQLISAASQRLRTT